MNLYFLLQQTARRYPDLGAVFYGDRQVLTYADLEHAALSLAAGLRGRVAPGSAIAVFSENHPALVEQFFGVWAANMVLTPVNAKLHPREVVQILEDAQAAIAFVSPAKFEGLEAAVAEAGLPTRLVASGSEDYEALKADPWAGPIASDPEALAWLFFTSGTTGRSKGARLSHRNLMALTLAHLADMDDPGTDTSLVHAAPMSHGSGLYVPAYVARGARQVVPTSGGFDPAEFFEICDDHPGCTAFFAPTMVQRLRLAAEASGTRPANLRTIIYGGGPMYLEEIRKSREVFGNVFVQIYGLGEAPMTITGLRRADIETGSDDVLASVGWPRSGVEVAVAAPDGTHLPPGEVGEVLVRGDIVMQGYLGNPTATVETLRDGWLWTGDMGSFDAGGCLTLRDRSKDMIVTGGTNVYPREVEEILLGHPAVQEVSVIGLPDAEWGEVVVAVVVPGPDGPPETADLDRLCTDRIARFKRPKRYVFQAELPKNNYGKVVKRDLREALAREGAK